MKVLHLNFSDVYGGAAIAGYRLHQGLLAQGIDSKLLVGRKDSGSDAVTKVPRRSYIETKIATLSQDLGLSYVSILSSFKIEQHPSYQAADVLNFHNLHSGYFNYLTLPKLTRKKPAIFTLHDMWSFTGHCSYSYDCDRWKTGCGNCPYPETYPSIKLDNTRTEWKLKNWIYDRSDLTIVAPSRWLVEQAKAGLLGRFDVHHIPYGIDTEAYQPLDQEHCRSLLGIPQDKKVLMFAAFSLSDSRKGSDVLVKALQALPSSLKSETLLLTIGTGSETLSEVVGMPTVNLGHVSNDRLKAIAYSAADLFLLPTRADNLPLVLQESLACGTPMVSFKVGGVPDVVRHRVTGYLASPNDAEDLGQGIVELLEDPDLRHQMQQNARAIAIEEYRLDQQADRYLELYCALLNR
ncbi:glycosyltransferase family 4 protein [Leptolyngbya sp. NIES-2104]|uniref:glycosyltransferase family 4 protein n=1 Tax=Leptolyngbya sp. NIES-2104 TaxID=1552121 RepID=UPI0006EC77DB|nr:glycosyltransferase family 4 protein [Leptolyngbya sp. NIES-2104]GAP97600.1 glycosyltransferase [Leptolyngbya sp. NIES-2104]